MKKRNKFILLLGIFLTLALYTYSYRVKESSTARFKIEF